MADINQSNNQPRITLSEASEYREGYANSVQVRASVWDFFLSFGTAHQDSPDQVTIRGFQGIYSQPPTGQGALQCARPEPRAI